MTGGLSGIILPFRNGLMTPNATLKDAIFRSGKTQLEVARSARIHETRLSKIVRGWVEPTDDEKAVLARVLHRRVGDLFALSSAGVS